MNSPKLTETVIINASDSVLTCSVAYLCNTCKQFIELFDIYQRESVLRPWLYQYFVDASYSLHIHYYNFLNKSEVSMAERQLLYRLLKETMEKAQHELSLNYDNVPQF